MPRNVIQDSDDELENVQPVRRTRAALAAVAAESPVRRSTRHRQGSVNAEESSPESIAGSQATRANKKRAAAPADPPRTLRSRKNSVTEIREIESAPGTPRGRSTKRQSIIELSPDSPKQATTKVRRSTRASSETKSPAPPTGRVTRQTRANSIEPEPIVDRATKASTAPPSTPSKRRRTLVSALPSEPVVTEEDNEDGVESKINDVSEEESRVESDSENSGRKEKRVKKSSKPSTPNISKRAEKKRSPSTKSKNSIVDDQKSPSKKLTKKSPVEPKVLRKKNKSIIDEDDDPDPFESLRAKGEIALLIQEDVDKFVVTSPVRTRLHSWEKTKELTKRIDDLLSTSSDEQATSPGNKENQKLNSSPDKAKKNLEFSVANVKVARSKSFGSPQLSNKATERKLNISVDEQVLSKLQNDIVSTATASAESKSSRRKLKRSIETKNDTISDDKSYTDLSPDDAESSNENQKKLSPRNSKVKSQEESVEDDQPMSSHHVNLKASYVKLDELVTENEGVEEFSLQDSDTGSEESPRFNLTIEDEADGAKSEISSKKAPASETTESAHSKFAGSDKSQKTEVDHSPESDVKSDSFSKHNRSKRASIEFSSESIGGKHTPEKTLNLNLRRVDEIQEPVSIVSQKEVILVDEGDDDEIPLPQNILNKEHQSTENKDADSAVQGGKRKSVSSETSQVNKSPVKSPSKIMINHDKDEAMSADETEHKETNRATSAVASPKKVSLNEQESSMKGKDSKTQSKNDDSDSDHSTIDNLFHDISADEWNKKSKSPSPNKRQSKGKSSQIEMESNATDTIEESDHDTISTETKSGKGDEKLDSHSDGTVILNKNHSVSKSKGNKKKSLGKNNSNAEEFEAASVREEPMEVDDNVTSDAETVPENTDSLEPSNAIEIVDEEILKDKLGEKVTTGSRKGTPKSATKKSIVVDEFEEILEGERSSQASDNSARKEKDPNTPSSKPISPHNSQCKNTLSVPQTPKDLKNYSIVGLVDSDSESPNVDDVEDSVCDDNTSGLPGYLFNTKFSSDEESSADEDTKEDESNETMDSDIAKEMNLDGDSNVKYSDDDICGDDCRASESEYSNEDDNGSDLGDFLVNDDEVESSENSEEEENEKNESSKTKFKRIVDLSSSEDEMNKSSKDEEIRENQEKENEKVAENQEEEEDEESDAVMEVEETNEKPKQKLLRKSPPHESPALSKNLSMESARDQAQSRKLNYSLESNQTLSSKKSKKEKVDLSSSKHTSTPCNENISKVKEASKQFALPLRSSVNTTVVDLCTPEQDTSNISVDKNVSQSSSLNTSIDTKLVKKLKKKLIKDLQDLTPEHNHSTKEAELRTPTTTPKSLKKKQRDSLEIIEDDGSAKSKISNARMSMLTPNSLTPVTKFLKKEKLNESLPLLKLNKKLKKSLGKTALSSMNEDQPEMDDVEADEQAQEELVEDSDNEECDTGGDAEAEGHDLNGSGYQNDDDEDETDEEPDKNEENGDDEKEENEHDGEDEDEDEDEEEEEEEDEFSKEDVSVKNKEKLRTEVTQKPKILTPEQTQKSTRKKSSSSSQDVVNGDESSHVIAKAKGHSKGSMNVKSTEPKDNSTIVKERLVVNSSNQPINNKKRARPESGDTPQLQKNSKKIRISQSINVSKENDSDSDEAPESIGFSVARTEALEAMKNVADSLKAAKEAKKKKRREQQERVRQEKEAKASRKSKAEETAKPDDQGKNTLKRLPEEILDNLSDEPQRPKKKRKLTKKEDQVLPSRSLFSPGEAPKSSIKIAGCTSPVSSAGATTVFSVVNLEKVKKQSKKALLVASFRDRMLARNIRQPVSAFQIYQAKQKASGKQLSSRK